MAVKKYMPFVVFGIFLVGYIAVSVGTGKCPACVAASLIANAGVSEKQDFSFYRKDLEVETIAGETIVMADWKGSPAVVNYWASWCGPCRKEIPAFNSAAASLGDVHFIGVSLDSDKDELLEFFDKNPVDYPVTMGAIGVEEMMKPIRSIPTTLFLDANGYLIKRHTGILSEEDIRKIVEKIE